MNVANRTPAKHLAVPIKDRDGRDQIVVIVKYTYHADAYGVVERDDEGREPCPVDVPNGEDPATSSIKRPSDMFDHKPGTDVLLIGEAHPRGNATQVDVSLRMGPIAKIVRAHGFRVWQKGVFGGLRPGPAMPIRAPVPLIYELAWGGLDLSAPDKPVGEPRNYVGRGVARNIAALVDKPAALLELPASPVGERGNVPASFGALHRHWQPRVSFGGTYDAAWEEARMPLLPRDFDPRFNVCAPPDQWSEVPLSGDEPIEVLGATPEGIWRFRLPRETPRFSSLQGGSRREHRTHLDTVLIDAIEMRVELTFRAAIPVPSKLELLDEVRITRGGPGP